MLSAYAGTGPATQAHVWIRSLTAPFREIDDLLPQGGQILDFGCGHGLLTNRLASSATARQLTGVDIDRAKVDHGRVASERLGIADRVAFCTIDPGWSPPTNSFDAVVCVDVLYLLGSEHALGLIDQLACAVRPGGALIVKEMSDRPRWKRMLTQVQERISTRVLHITKGPALEFVRTNDIEGVAATLGFETTTVRLDHRRMHPHVMVTGHRPLNAPET